jgi:hypothetical protein
MMRSELGVLVLRLLQAFVLSIVLVLLAGCSQNGVHRSLSRSLPSVGEQQATVLAVYQPWFGSSDHINVGYSAQDPAVLEKQVRQAKDFGISGFVVDWYDKRRPEFDHTYAMLQGIAARENFRTALMYDEPEGEPESSTQDAIVALDYAYDRYFGPNAANRGAYLRFNGRPVVFVWPRSKRTNWDAVRQHLTQWETQPVLILRYGNTPYARDFDGFYAWVNPGEKGWAPDGSNWGKTYLDDFYRKMENQYPNKLIVAGVWPGFDDSRASWGSHRKISQRCGRTFQDTMAEFRHNMSPDHPIPYLLIETWNDYEEGTAIERGIQKCSSNDYGPISTP